MATPQEIQAWLAANPGANDQAISQAMQQYGVTPQQMAGATGMDPTQVQNRYNAAAPMASGLPGVADARAWLDGQLGGSFGADGFRKPGSVFGANGVYDMSNSLRNDQVFGKAKQMGYSNDEISKILGMPVDQVNAFQQDPNNIPGINTFASVFQHDVTNPAPYMLGSPQSTPTAGGPTPQNGHQVGGIGGAGGVMGTMGGQSGSASGVGPLGSYSANPYLGQMAQGITTQLDNNLQRNLLPGIRSGAVANGQVGSSREGIAQGLAMGDTQNALSGALGNLYGTDYTNQMNRNLQQYGMDQNYALGQGGLDNQRYGMDQNFYSNQRGQDLNALGLGANIYDIANRDGWTGLLNAGNIFNTTAGNNTTSTTGGTAGGGLTGLLGGALAGGALAGQAGWWK
jgi:hypothetical protein